MNFLLFFYNSFLFYFEITSRNVFIEISGFSTEYMKNTKQVILFNKYNSHMKIYFSWNLNNGKKPYILKTEGLLE